MNNRKVRKFRGNNVIKGRVQMQMRPYINNGAITFEEGSRRNTCIIIINESKIPHQNEIDYLYDYLLGRSREIIGC